MINHDGDKPSCIQSERYQICGGLAEKQRLAKALLKWSLNGLAPNYLFSKFIQRSDVITAYNLHDSDGKLAIPLPRTNYYKNSFGYSGAVLWNSLPSAAR